MAILIRLMFKMLNTALPEGTTMAYHSTGRLDEIAAHLERLHKDAHDIFNAHVDGLRCRAPAHVGFGALKARLLAPAGPAVNYIEALKLLRERFRRNG
jgi:hypothetical protein